MGSKKITAKRKKTPKQAALPSFKSRQELDAFLPTLECQQLCQRSCSIIPYSESEKQYILDGGMSAPTTIGDPAQGVARCSALDASGRCTIYARRPMICQLYGLTEAMRCPFGCVPSRWLTKEDAYAILLTASFLHE